jgi:uncharacterized protein (DUF433 family)
MPTARVVQYASRAFGRVSALDQALFRIEGAHIMGTSYQDIITLEPGKRSGKPTIRGLRITVYDVLSYLAAGMTAKEIVDDFPYLTEQDIQACLSYAADRERQLLIAQT